MIKEQASELWRRIRDRLDQDLGADAWRQQIRELGQTQALVRRESGSMLWADSEVFEGLVKSVLSNSTDWSKIEHIKSQLADQFCGFDVHRFAKAADPQMVSECVDWFKSKHAGAMTVRKDLSRLGKCAEIMCRRSQEFGSLENYLQQLNTLHRSPEAVAVSIGDSRSSDKLPGIGIPLAAEFLKNVGFDVCKPDRHINRAMASFGLVHFRAGTGEGEFSSPTASLEEMLEVMRAMKSLATLVGISTIYADNAIWLLCAKSGDHLSNSKLKDFAPSLRSR